MDRERACMIQNYRIIGSGQVDVVVELGLGSCLAEWIPMARMLSEEGHAILLYERFGINQSAPARNPRTPWNIAEELYQLLAEITHNIRKTPPGIPGCHSTVEEGNIRKPLPGIPGGHSTVVEGNMRRIILLAHSQGGTVCATVLPPVSRTGRKTDSSGSALCQ